MGAGERAKCSLQHSAQATRSTPKRIICSHTERPLDPEDPEDEATGPASWGLPRSPPRRLH